MVAGGEMRFGGAMGWWYGGKKDKRQFSFTKASEDEESHNIKVLKG
jgi:hypothetical protein